MVGFVAIRGNTMGDHSIYDRGSNRLSGYDYSQPGAYFITIGSYHRKAIFGQILEAAFIPTLAGKIVREEWFRSTQNRSEIDLNAFTLMLNHLHGIIWINDSVPQSVGAHGRAPLIWNDLSSTNQLLKMLFDPFVLNAQGGRAGKMAKEKGGQGTIDDGST